MDLWNEKDRVQKVVSCRQGGVGEGKRAVRKKRTRLNTLQGCNPQWITGWENEQRSTSREDQYGSKMQNSRKEYITGESSYTAVSSSSCILQITTKSSKSLCID